MRHVYIRGMIGFIWLAVALVCGLETRWEMAGLYVLLGGAFLYSAYAAWKKEKDHRGER